MNATRLVTIAAVLSFGALAQSVTPPFDAAILPGAPQTHFRAVLDYDGDGRPDAMSASFAQGNVTMAGYRNVAGSLVLDWSLSFSGVYQGVEPKSVVAAGDFDGDGLDDFAFSIYQFVGVWISNGAGVPPTIAQGLTEPVPVDQILAADFSGDGRPDLALREGPLLRIFDTQPSAPPVLVSSCDLTTGLSTTHRIFLVEANGDTTMDVGAQTTFGSFFVPTTISVFVLPGPAALVPAATYPILPTFATRPVAGDIDGDADEDLVLFSSTQRVVMRRTGPATFAVEPVIPGGGTHDELADVDQDGDLDALGTSASSFPGSQNGHFIFALNDGTGVFTPNMAVECSSVNSLYASGLAGAVDLDQDGDLDFVGGNSVYFWRETEPAEAFGTSLFGPRDLADIDDDGDLDAMPGVAVSVPQGEPQMRANRGDGVLEPLQYLAPFPPSGFNWRGPGFPGDFDGDGDVDLLIDTVLIGQSSPGLATHLLRNVGAGAFVDQGPVLPAGVALSNSVDSMMPANSRAIDLDGDADVDLAVTHWYSSSTDTVIYWNLGAATFQAGPTLPQCRILEVADMNGDGSLDFVVQAAPTSLVVQFRQGSAYSAGPVVDATSLAATVGDFDGDGDSDLYSISASSAKLYWNDGAGGFGAPTLFPGLQQPFTVSTFVRAPFALDVDLDGLTDIVSPRPVGVSNGCAILLRDGPGGALGAPILQIMQPVAFDDLDGDGDADSLSDDNGLKFTGRNLRYARPSSGYRLQYGAGTAGSGGKVPILGETGPFRAGSPCELRIRGGLGGAAGYLGLGSAPDSVSIIGITLLVVPELTVPIDLSGAPGVPSVGSFSLPFVMPPSLAGLSFFHQAGFFDPAAPMGFSATNGLRIDVGP